MEFTVGKFTYRTKTLNAIEGFAMRTQLDFDTYENSETALKLILEHLEVKIGNTWVPVKEKDREIYYPEGLENDFETIQTLFKTYMKDYFAPLFRKSSELN